ncbi:MAG: UDP-N-acetylmuramoyl-tripeptide--D-alanyl-D-alanine ligase [Bacteroidota bacterium]
MESLYTKFLESGGVSTDTRTLKPGDLYFALRGPNFNGNQYAAKAIEEGADYAIIDDKAFEGPNTILVEDSLKALQDLARYHRDRFKGKLLALTGSNGKTTTKELLNRVLSTKYKTLATKGNLNNHIGVPLTLLEMTDETEIAIIEMGANHVGEIENLSRIADPEFGLITNIGEAHTETFGGIEGVFKGKTELFNHINKKQGTIFVNTADPRLKPFGDLDHAICYPNEDVSFIGAEPMIRFGLGEKEIKTQTIGAYNYQNITAAICVGRYFQISDKAIAEAISTYVSGNQRSQVISKGLLKIVMDGYNANPTSMSAALESFTRLQGSKHVILGDMKEVEDSINRHRTFGKELKSLGFKTVILVGPEMKHASEQVDGSKWFETSEAAKDYLKSNPIKEGNLLIKGSRSMKMEKVLEAIS